MKNLFIYVNPNGFDEESGKLTKIQIDNSLELGWPIEDILLVTNFPYEHNGVNAYVVDIERSYCPFVATASKIKTVDYLFDIDFIGDDIYWLQSSGRPNF